MSVLIDGCTSLKQSMETGQKILRTFEEEQKRAHKLLIQPLQTTQQMNAKAAEDAALTGLQNIVHSPVWRYVPT